MKTLKDKLELLEDKCVDFECCIEIINEIKEDVKEHILSFEKYLDEKVWKKEENIIFYKFREIFGDFEK